MVGTNTLHNVSWANSKMGKLWASHGHSVYPEEARIPGLDRFRIQTPHQTHFGDTT